jgi:hypothetical protein
MEFQQGSPWSVHHPDTGIDWNLITHHKCKLGLNIGANGKQRVRWFWSISSGAQYVTLQKYLSYLSLVIYSFPTPPIKPELGLQIGGRLLMAIQLDQSNYLAYQQQQVLGIAVSFTSISILCKNAGRLNPFCRAKPTGFWVFFIEFPCAGSHTDHRWSCC